MSSPTKIEDSISYTAQATATWDTWSWLDDDYEQQSDYGHDFLGFSWGGEYNSTNEVFNVQMSYGDGDLADIRTEGISPNKSYGWAFREKLSYWENVYEPKVEKAVGTLRLSKNNYQGENTKIVAQYIHTYGDENYSFNVSTGGLGFTVTPTQNQWPLQVDLNIEY